MFALELGLGDRVRVRVALGLELRGDVEERGDVEPATIFAPKKESYGKAGSSRGASIPTNVLMGFFALTIYEQGRIIGGRVVVIVMIRVTV